MLASGCGGDASGPAPDTLGDSAIVDTIVDSDDSAVLDGVPDPTPEAINICGEVTTQGTCYGDVLRTCPDGTLRERDCTAENGADGQPRVCRFVADQRTNDCVDQPPQVVDNGCHNETIDGRCDGSNVVYCMSPETGPTSYDCAPDKECYLSVAGYADCRLPGTPGCDGISYQGYCEGAVAVWCDLETTTLVSYDCAADNAPCGFIDDDVGYSCDFPPVVDGTYSVTGAFYFEKPALGPQGLGAIGEMPIRYAFVQLRLAADDTIIASGTTDDAGAFTIGYEATGDVYATVSTFVDDATYTLSVRDCPLENCDGAGYLHGINTPTFTPEANGDIGGWLAEVSINAGAFNIFDVYLHAIDFGWANFGAKPPALTVQWAHGTDNALCPGISCFTSRPPTIFVVSLSADSDEFDDPVLGHEFGHFLESSFSRSDSPGGDHDGSPTDPRLAWGEGYGTYTGSEILGSPIYIDTWASGATSWDISDSGYRASPGGGMSQNLSEFLVAEVLWTLSHGGVTTGPLGSAVIFDVLARYFPTNRLVDRGVDGVDLVDFLDGLMCRDTGRERYVRLVTVDHLRFPYDFGGTASCR